jgi:hypothetical protein
LLLPAYQRHQDKIDGLASKHPDRFKVFYVVDKPK